MLLDHAIDCGIVSTSQNFVKQMLAAGSTSLSSDEWVKTAGSLKDFKTEHDNEPEEISPGRLHPYHAVRKFYQSIPEDSIVVVDGGEAGGWALSNLEEARASLAMVSTGYLGFLGNGWGYALGAAIADPSRLVVLSHGDGSAGFHLTELDTFARFKLKILTVIINNYKWGMSAAGQDLIYGEATPTRQASKLSPGTAYETVAAGLQCASAKVDKMADLPGAVKQLVDSGKPGLLNLIVADKPVHAMTKAMLNVNVSKNWIVVPYYDNVPRPYYKLD